jgi:hypothetical protein
MKMDRPFSIFGAQTTVALPFLRRGLALSMKTRISPQVRVLNLLS